MSKPPMLEIAGDRGESRRGRAAIGAVERIERAGATGAQKNFLGEKILHRKAKRIKFDGTLIITSKLTYRNQICDNIR